MQRVRVCDRFGDYGLVGVMIAQTRSQVWELDTFLLSCRVLGRGVEHAMARSLGQAAQERGLDVVELRVINTARNEPARAFADSIVGTNCETSEGGCIYRLPVAQALEIRHRPGHDPAAVLEARQAEERKGVDKSTNSLKESARSERYSRLGSVLMSGDALLRELSLQGRRPRDLSTLLTPAASKLEADLQALWEEVLSVDGLGVEDDYFALGGTSLQSVKLFSEIERRFGVQLRLTSILAAPTVRALAGLIETASVATCGALVPLRTGGSHNLFLVHDGLGETLLYLNLARRLPSTLSVYGIEPRRLPGIALAHANMEDMAAYYVEQMRSVQPQGPYRLGGMCAGGVIAYAMAAHLRGLGERVEVVTILDGATPQAPRRSGRIAKERLSRMRNLMQGHLKPSTKAGAAWALLAALASKVWSGLRYEVLAALQRKSARLRFLLLQSLVRRDRSWPGWLPELSVAQIFSALEARYQPPLLADVAVLLVRASQGSGDDTPCRDIYSGDDFGWRQVAARLVLTDVAGGHASMLQEIHVDSLASALMAQLPAWSETSVGSAT